MIGMYRTCFHRQNQLKGKTILLLDYQLFWCDRADAVSLLSKTQYSSSCPLGPQRLNIQQFCLQIHVISLLDWLFDIQSDRVKKIFYILRWLKGVYASFDLRKFYKDLYTNYMLLMQRHALHLIIILLLEAGLEKLRFCSRRKYVQGWFDSDPRFGQGCAVTGLSPLLYN